MMPLVTLLLPVFNEAEYIGACLEALSGQSYEETEILVIDGGSTDRTVAIAEAYSSRSRKIRILHNSKRYSPFGLNLGIREAQGDIIFHLAAHAAYPSDYIERCVNLHREHPEAWNVGGLTRVAPGSGTCIARAIAVSVSTRFGVGAVAFKFGRTSGYVSSLFPGSFKKKVFERAGMFDERLVRGQDQELNARITRCGGKLYLDTSFSVTYFARRTLPELAFQYFITGRSIVYSSRVLKRPITLRQLVPFLFCMGLALSGAAGISGSMLHRAGFLWYVPLFFLAGAYCAAGAVSAVASAVSRREICCILLPAVYAVVHASYGAGTLVGLMTLGTWWNRHKNRHLRKKGVTV